MNLSGLWDQLVDAVCRPPRDENYTEEDLVGGRRASFRLYDRRYYRLDVTLENKRGQKLQGSHYRPCVVTSSDGRLPCVIYCHCNSGSRRDAEEILYHLLPKGITVFAFDFVGSGLSDGSYVTLGAMEVDDLAAVVQHLREEGSSSTIGLWGRSMGAVTALLYSQLDPSIAGMVLDSPFSRLVDLMMELAVEQQLRVPRPLLKMALAMLKRSVKKRAGFSVDKVAPLDCVGNSFIPALFGHASDDTFVNKHHSERLFQAYAGDKNFVSFEGDHNSIRPDFFYDSALIFLIQALRVEELVGPTIDLHALPEDALPHLHPARNSIYVTASRNLSSMLEEETASAAAGAAGSGASSPRSGSSLSPARSRPPQFRPPWALQSTQGQPRPAHAAATAGAAPLQQENGLQHGQQAGENGDAAALASDMDAFQLSEDQALQMALEASLMDARQQLQPQPQQAEEAAAAAVTPGSAPAADGVSTQIPAEGMQLQQAGAPQQGAAPLHTRYNPAFASSGSDGTRNPLYGGSSAGDLPRTSDEEEAMLAAAIAASLQPPQGAATAQAPAVESSRPAAAGVAVGSTDSELRYYPSASRPTTTASKHQPQGGNTEGQAADQRAISNNAAAGAAQAAADAHAGQEAAAARTPSLELQHAISEAANAMIGPAGAGNGEDVAGFGGGSGAHTS